MMSRIPIRRVRPSEEGYILVAVMFMLALLIISMAVALPKVAQDIQRDRDLETFHRGMQYRRAIQLYYRKFNRYPPNVDALVKTNEIRFLRKKYIDPITGKDDWKPIMFGQNKTPMAMGFFGQAMAGVGMGPGALAGTGPSGGNGIAGASPIGGTGGSSFGGSSPIGGSSSFGSSSPIGGPGSIGGQTGSVATPGGTGFNATSPTGATGPTDANGNPTDPNAAGGQIAGASPIAGQTFGGAGIIGVSPASDKQSIFVYKKKNHYNEWEFLYSPLSDQGMLGGASPTGIQPAQPGVGTPGTPFGPAGGTNSPMSPTSPTSPISPTSPTQPPTPTTPPQ